MLYLEIIGYIYKLSIITTINKSKHIIERYVFPIELKYSISEYKIPIKLFNIIPIKIPWKKFILYNRKKSLVGDMSPSFINFPFIEKSVVIAGPSNIEHTNNIDIDM